MDDLSRFPRFLQEGRYIPDDALLPPLPSKRPPATKRSRQAPIVLKIITATSSRVLTFTEEEREDDPDLLAALKRSLVTSY